MRPVWCLRAPPVVWPSPPHAPLSASVSSMLPLLSVLPAPSQIGLGCATNSPETHSNVKMGCIKLNNVGNYTRVLFHV